MVWWPTGYRTVGFKDGKLYVFKPNSITVMRGWPNPLAWRKTPDLDWHMVRPEIDVASDPGPDWESHKSEFVGLAQILSDNMGAFTDDEKELEFEHRLTLREIREQTAYHQFFEPIPPEVKTAMALFPDRQWHILSMAARCPGALDLIFSNPALAWSLASNWVFHKPAVKQPMRAARSLIRHRQREILDWLGFPGTESGRKLLRKVSRQSLSIPRLLYLRTSMHNTETSKILAHLPRINAGVIRLATDPAFMNHLSPRFLQDVSIDPDELIRPKSAKTVKDVLRMADLLRPAGMDILISSADALNTIHNELIVLLNNRNRRNLLAYRESDSEHLMQYPSPPIPPNSNILPITCTDDLYEEGIEQQNCVASYQEEILNGNIYIYRILYPQRATLSIEPDQDGWRIDQLLTAQNRHVSQETLHYVQDWLARKGLDENQLLLDWEKGHQNKKQMKLNWECPNLEAA